MHITNHQMHNVLKVYTNHLSKCRAPVHDSRAVRKPTADANDVSTDGKRRNLIDRISSDIVARIRNGGGPDTGATGITAHFKNESTAPSAAPNSRQAQFVYNVIRGESEKKKKTLSVEDADFLTRRFEELVRKMMDRSAPSSSV